VVGGVHAVGGSALVEAELQACDLAEHAALEAVRVLDGAGHARLPGHVLHGDVVEAPPGEEREGGLLDPLALLRAVSFPAVGPAGRLLPGYPRVRVQEMLD
jgi:hypothetical protein